MLKVFCPKYRVATVKVLAGARHESRQQTAYRSQAGLQARVKLDYRMATG
jgi:hypothetical protein